MSVAVIVRPATRFAAYVRSPGTVRVVVRLAKALAEATVVVAAANLVYEAGRRIYYNARDAWHNKLLRRSAQERGWNTYGAWETNIPRPKPIGRITPFVAKTGMMALASFSTLISLPFVFLVKPAAQAIQWVLGMPVRLAGRAAMRRPTPTRHAVSLVAASVFMVLSFPFYLIESGIRHWSRWNTQTVLDWDARYGMVKPEHQIRLRPVHGPSTEEIRVASGSLDTKDTGTTKVTEEPKPEPTSGATLEQVEAKVREGVDIVFAAEQKEHARTHDQLIDAIHAKISPEHLSKEIKFGPIFQALADLSQDDLDKVLDRAITMAEHDAGEEHKANYRVSQEHLLAAANLTSEQQVILAIDLNAMSDAPRLEGQKAAQRLEALEPGSAQHQWLTIFRQLQEEGATGAQIAQFHKGYQSVGKRR